MLLLLPASFRLDRKITVLSFLAKEDMDSFDAYRVGFRAIMITGSMQTGRSLGFAGIFRMHEGMDEQTSERAYGRTNICLFYEASSWCNTGKLTGYAVERHSDDHMSDLLTGGPSPSGI